MNNRTKFFKNVVLFQFIPIFILGLLILSSFREQKTLRIRGLHPFEFNYGYAVPLFVFVFGLVLSLVSLLFKQGNLQQEEGEDLKKLRRQNFWKFVFYCNLFLVLVITVFTIIISREEPFVIDQPVLFYVAVVLRALLVVIISLVVASFFLTAGISWKTNKALAVVVLIFSFLIVGTSIGGDVLFMGKFNDASESYKMAKNEKRIPREGEEEVGDYDG